jgi:hypothetical protein
MIEPSKPKADYQLIPDPESLGMVTAFRPAPTPRRIARREEIWKFCNAITWRQLREHGQAKRHAG